MQDAHTRPCPAATSDKQGLLCRRRSDLAQKRNRLFGWLPLLNFLVMLAVLAYQSPWESLLHHTDISAWVPPDALTHRLSICLQEPGQLHIVWCSLLCSFLVMLAVFTCQSLWGSLLHRTDMSAWVPP